ncbi:MAG: RnfABCDGE type electron transport complex subunit D [Ruminococcaceae bacterium]|nr:RnfABCDGE type electron transport complex subunit D [Oscillospiraceae bacterium]
MTGDYKALKLIASSNPHIRNNEDTRSIMLDVIIALCPALAWSVFRFGFRALIAALVSVGSALCWEWAYRKVLNKPQMLGDLSAAVTGLLLSMVCPVTLPYWMLVIGNFFAIVVVKQLYGGLGKNFMNPALAGRAALVACYASQMTSWIAPGEKAPLSMINADVVTAATPMAMMGEDFAGLTVKYGVRDMFVGLIGGSAGEISAMMLLIGGLYLIWRKVISWHIPVAYIGTVALLALITTPAGSSPLTYMAYSVFGGGLMLGAFFMATDYVTSPVTKKGQLIFGVGCGLLTVFIRKFGSFPEGVCYSILLMNCTVWIIDQHVKPIRFGVDPEKEKAKKAEEKAKKKEAAAK